MLTSKRTTDKLNFFPQLLSFSLTMKAVILLIFTLHLFIFLSYIAPKRPRPDSLQAPLKDLKSREAKSVKKRLWLSISYIGLSNKLELLQAVVLKGAGGTSPWCQHCCSQRQHIQLAELTKL